MTLEQDLYRRTFKIGEDMPKETELVEALWALFSSKGERTIQSIEKRLGWPENKIHKARRRKNGFYLSEFLEILEAVDAPPAWFFSHALGRTSLVDSFIREGKINISNLGLHIPDLISPNYSAQRSKCAKLESLKILVHVDAGKVESEAYFLMEEYGARGESRLYVEALALLAKSFMEQDKLDFAQAYLSHALQIVELSDYRSRLNLVLRASQVLMQRGEFCEAVELANSVLIESIERDYSLGVSLALLLGAGGCRRLGHRASAENRLRMARVFLPERSSKECRRVRAAIEHEFGLLYEDLGELEKACRHAKRAMREQGLLPGAQTARLFWLLARIAAKRGKLTSAESYYRQALDRVGDSSSTAAQIACELARVFIIGDQMSKAVGLVSGFLRFVNSQENKLVEDTMTDLVLSAFRGVLGLKKVEASSFSSS